MIPLPKNTSAKSTIALMEAIAYNAAERATGYINIESLGCRPDMKNDSGKILSDYIASQPENASIRLFVPQGKYWLGTTLYYADRKVSIRGVGMNDSIFYSMPGIDAIFIDSKKNEVYDGVLENFSVLPYGKPTTICHGIKVWQRTTLQRVHVQGFTGRGIWVDGFATGDGKHDDKHNATFTKIMHCSVIANGWEGVLIDGQDGSQTVTFCNDIRNNGYYGIRDSTFLGCPHIGNLLHANGHALPGELKGIGFVLDHPNATGAFVAGNYFENDNSRLLVWRSTDMRGNTGLIGVEYWDDKTAEETQAIKNINLGMNTQEAGRVDKQILEINK